MKPLKLLFANSKQKFDIRTFTRPSNTISEKATIIHNTFIVISEL